MGACNNDDIFLDGSCLIIDIPLEIVVIIKWRVILYVKNHSFRKETNDAEERKKKVLHTEISIFKNCQLLVRRALPTNHF